MMNINEFLRQFIDSAAVYICVVDRATDDILLVNEYYAKHLGVSKEYMEQHKCWEFVDAEKGPCTFCPRNAPSDNLRVTQFFNPTLGIWGEYTAYPVEWIDGRAADIITITDISNEKILRDKLEKLAYYDRVTGLPNMTRLELDMENYASSEYCAIAFGRIALYEINDKYGRKTGDALLSAVTAWTVSLGLKNTSIYRVDGNVFCMIIHNISCSSALTLAEQMQERFAQAWEITHNGNTELIYTNISLCIADGRSGFVAADDLISKIELTLDKAKTEKRILVYGDKLKG